MITRLEIDGFKNLVGVNLHFGRFTCIAGPNGAGKSNLFDAIRFLGALASPQSLMEAAATVRDNRRASDIRSIFHRVGSKCASRMRFAVEMIVRPSAIDDLGQPATAAITFLRYELELGLREDTDVTGPSLEILHEALLPIKQSEAFSHLPFEHKPVWRSSVIKGARRGGPFVSTMEKEGRLVVQRHQDGGGGNPIPATAQSLKRTIISAATAEAPTLLCARREMESWLQLQLEPTALRQPSDLNAPPHLQPDGAHLPATLYRIARASQNPEGVYARVANRLAELIRDVRDVSVERDDKLELLTLVLTDRENTAHPARSLSDGTLRFLALTVLEIDPDAYGVLCLEEPENGIHPDRISAMLTLLKDIAMDVSCAAGPDNPLRQIIINTHSPLIVGECPEDALILARSVQTIVAGQSFNKVAFQGVVDTWRAKGAYHSVSRGQLLSYLAPGCLQPACNAPSPPSKSAARRIRDREDLMQETMPFWEGLVAET